MPHNSNAHLLQASINDLPFSTRFKGIAGKLNFIKLGEIVEIEVAALIKLPGFNYHALMELTQFLEERNLANLLKQG